MNSNKQCITRKFVIRTSQFLPGGSGAKEAQTLKWSLLPLMCPWTRSCTLTLWKSAFCTRRMGKNWIHGYIKMLHIPETYVPAIMRWFLRLKCPCCVQSIVCFLPPEKEDDTVAWSAEHPWSECIRNVAEMFYTHTHTGTCMYISV